MIRRYEHQSPGDLVHVDIKKLGRIPDGGGHRSIGRAAGNRNKTGTTANRRPGYAFLHNAVDDHSRLAYTEILTDEKKDTAAGFWERANAYFESCGITVKRVLTDNGSCYRSHAFKDALGREIKHKRTRPTGRRQTAKLSDTTAPCSMNGPTRSPMRQKASVLPHSPTGSITTIITEATPHSKVSHQSAVSLTSQVNTSSIRGQLVDIDEAITDASKLEAKEEGEAAYEAAWANFQRKTDQLSRATMREPLLPFGHLHRRPPRCPCTPGSPSPASGVHLRKPSSHIYAALNGEDVEIGYFVINMSPGPIYDVVQYSRENGSIGLLDCKDVLLPGQEHQFTEADYTELPRRSFASGIWEHAVLEDARRSHRQRALL